MISFCFTHKNRLELNIGTEILPLFKNCLSTLKNCLESLGIDEYEICVSSWDEEEDYKKLDNFLKNLFSHDKIKIKKISKYQNFSRGTGRNESFEQSSGDIIFFLDVDMLFMRSEMISNALIAIRENKVYFPICYSMYEDGSGDWRPWGYGNCVVPRSAMLGIRWIHKETWGKEDDIFHEEMRKKYKIVREKCAGYYHQWHPSLAPGKGWSK